MQSSCVKQSMDGWISTTTLRQRSKTHDTQPRAQLWQSSEELPPAQLTHARARGICQNAPHLYKCTYRSHQARANQSTERQRATQTLYETAHDMNTNNPTVTHHNITPTTQHWVRVCDIQTHQLVWSSVDNMYVGDSVKISRLSRYDSLRRSV